MHTLLTDRIAQGLQDIEKEPLLPEDAIQIYGLRGATFDHHLVDWARRKPTTHDPAWDIEQFAIL